MSVRNGLFEWERPLYELEQRIQELQEFTAEKDIDLSREIATLEKRADHLRREIYASLSAWQQVLLARHPKRPTALDYIELIFDDFYELHGDRGYRDDSAIVGGLAIFDGLPVTVIGPQKGRDTKENIQRNFGLPHPEGYRKALRLMEQAEKFERPIISLIDVVGAYPGIEAEERGQGVVIAENIRRMSFLKVPIVCVITGEGGSGGALAIGVGDKILMLEHGWYSVISPEMCAQILWRDSSKAPEAAKALKLTAADLMSIEAIDGIVPEPFGGAHKNHEEAAANLKKSINNALKEIISVPVDALVEQRLRRFRKMGQWQEKAAVVVSKVEQ
ncbi:MAG: acetyl-CoA carboxylase carboxyltransferase subunit alpha [Firmicutes bacterium]|nr:acetyl-CoA carboxylase carboxyltransferase subunit alpha [Bacillota bacterium]